MQVLRRAQLVLPQPLHVQSPGANIPALGLCNLCLCLMAVQFHLNVTDTTGCTHLFCNLWGNNTNGTCAHLWFQTAAGLPKTFGKASIRHSWTATWGCSPAEKATPSTMQAQTDCAPGGPCGAAAVAPRPPPGAPALSRPRLAPRPPPLPPPPPGFAALQRLHVPLQCMHSISSALPNDMGHSCGTALTIIGLSQDRALRPQSQTGPVQFL